MVWQRGNQGQVFLLDDVLNLFYFYSSIDDELECCESEQAIDELSMLVRCTM